MSIRDWQDVIFACDQYDALMRRIWGILCIVQETGWWECGSFSHMRIEKLDADALTVGFYSVDGHEHWGTEDVIDSAAFPPGLGLGWKPTAEDIVGTRGVYSHTTYRIIRVAGLTIPSVDLGICDDEQLVDVRARYAQLVADRDKAIKVEHLKERLSKTQDEALQTKDELAHLLGDNSCPKGERELP